jgi:hypothetical protein
VLPARYRKRSFLRFNAPIDQDRLLRDYHAISESAWLSSYWGNVHCSVGMLLLRGGGSGTPEDFYSDEVHDQPLLLELPYIEELIGASGAFGKAEFAFLFRMEPDGVTLAHNDYMERWHDLYRIHVPIITNNRAFLIAEGRSQHFAAGHAWSFDNQSRHGVINGPHTRIHLIFDVPFGDALAAQLDKADHLPGKKKSGHLEKIDSKVKARPSYPGDVAVREAITSLRGRGLNDERIAEFLNAKEIPTRHYDIRRPKGLADWRAGDIQQIEPG